MDRVESLRIFCRVVDVGSFSRAAGQLKMSNASVTHHVAGLEKHFGVRLLNRTTRKLSLTDDGRSCYERAQRLIGEMVELEELLQGATLVPKGVLRVEVPTAIGRIYIAPALLALTRQYPELSVVVNVTDRTVDAIEERADVLIRIGALKDSTMVARTLHQSRFLCCASPELLREYGVPRTPDDLARFPCLGFTQPNSGQLVPWQFASGGKKIAFVPKTHIAINHAESLIHAAVGGAGVLQLLSLSLAPAIQAGQLVPVLADWSTAGPMVSVLYPHNRHLSPKVRVFVDFIVALFAREVGQ